MKKRTTLLSLVAVFAVTLVAYAAVIFDSDTGTGFVGKGDVQLVYGWNNKQLQDNASSVLFRYASGETISWTCVDPDPSTPPNPATVTRLSTQGVAGAPDADPRQVKGQKQFTGFILFGYNGDPEVVSEGEHDYPECGPNRVHDPSQDVVTPLGGGLQVSIDGSEWYDLQ